MVALYPGPIEVGGIQLKNHLLLAAGILGTTGASLARILQNGAGGVVTKSIGPSPKVGHPGPCLVVVDGGIINAMGLPNPSTAFVDELAVLHGEPVIVSIFGGTPEEFRTVAGWFVGKASGFELNLSCPHAEGYGAAIGSDPALVEECTRAVASLGVPTWVKLTPNVTDITEIGAAAERGGADAIVAINTVKAMRISTALRRPVLGNRFGGLSGKAIFPIAVRCVYDLYESCSIPIIGCGGVSTADNVIEMMMAGASAVEIGSAIIDDISIFATIAEDLYSPDGIDAREIVGCAHA
ncbi:MULTISPECIES: dihydroorotate dehydrogenase [Methanoculleus]|jgi:dihydroorotate dehydrogenase (NAD+) catalytic subunit|uniref:Dihydroorotate dehydrogenase n=1 Tax=Methanoculleus thermophilus TaxID=2200 RepID=A0A1G8Y202_9EURY|nr:MULTISPECIES: dihydroorotate dehydrogenase [Methanoculleus]NLN09524.1 dihydroorotate dehydrogenase [Methanoculleus thermophilus]SDJ96889.1 dihydroorotate dehydrogenase (NAD+) catalytic subunit [Methanoculleus thermophilus]HQD25756.1 dihydroorotate dehydrogenase [Methanoculleus thermophilus]